MSEFLTLGRKNPHDDAEPFNMAYLALNGCGAANGVSRLHGQVSRRLFQALFPNWPEAEVPVGHVTNGIHTPTWECPSARHYWDRASCESRWLKETNDLERGIRTVSDATLWTMRSEARRALVEYTRKRVARQRSNQGAMPGEIAAAERIFNFDTRIFCCMTLIAWRGSWSTPSSRFS